MTPSSPDTLAAFLTRWQASGGSERANYQLFITELCALLGVPLPDPARDDTRDNAYVFERRIVFAHGDGSQSNGFIDCYRRGHFVLEAKKIADGAAKLGRKTFDDALLRARSQAEAHAEARAAWTEALLERLVALNTRRAAEEATGLIRWLRPDFQDPARRAAASTTTPAVERSPTEQTALAIDAPAPDAAEDDAGTGAPASPAAAPVARMPWPTDLKAQLRSVADLLADSPVALTLEQIADRYTSRGPWKKRLPDLLATLEALARARCEGGVWRGV